MTQIDHVALDVLRHAAETAVTDAEALVVSEQIRSWLRKAIAAEWEPYPWQHPHHHPDGWVSERAPGVCDERCFDLPTIPIPTQGIWLEYGGRGTGKTEGAAHYVNAHVEGPACDHRLRGGHKLLIIGPTQGDAIDAAVTGPSGLQTINPDVTITTTRGGTFVRWPNGARARILGGSTKDDIDSTRASGNNCIAEGTLIRTARGLVPVEDVTTGDHVWTRTGLRAVTHTRATGIRWTRPLTTPAGQTWVTSDHPVPLADGRWVTADRVDGRVLVWPAESSTPASPSTSGPPATGRTPAPVSSTEPSTPARSAPFPTGGRSTTSTLTVATTTRLTSSPSPSPTTAPFTPTAPTGTPPVAVRPRVSSRPVQGSVRSAATPSPTGRPSTPDGAPTGAAPGPVQHEHSSLACAACVATGSPPDLTPPPAPVALPVVVGPPTRLGPVYDLTVEGHHEFFAGDLLVGNCLIYLEEAAAIRRLGDIMTTATPGLRTGPSPHWVAATTPKNRPEMKALRERPGVIVTKGRTRDAHRLDAETRRVWESLYANTTAGRQELDAEELGDVEGALWVTHRPDLVDGKPNADQRPGIDNDRLDPADVGWVPHARPPGLTEGAAAAGLTLPPVPVPPAAPRLTVTRVVVAVDPPGGATEAGITVEASAASHGYTLADLSLKAPPNTWALTALCAYFDYGAEGLVIEHAYGGDMVPNTVATLCTLLGIPTPPIFKAKTKVGKRLRAEPVQALYQQHRQHHVGVLPGLETEQTTWVPDETTESPNRIDAHVHGQTYLLVQYGTGTVSNPARLTTRIGPR